MSEQRHHYRPRRGSAAGPDGMTPRQRRYALEYLANGQRGEQAALAAGYAASHAGAKSSELLRHQAVRAFIAEAAARTQARLDLDAERVLGEVMRIGFADVRRLLRPDGSILHPCQWPADVAQAVASVEYDEALGTVKRVKLWDKPKALEMLGRNLKLWTDVVEARVGRLDDHAKAARAAELIAQVLSRREVPALPASKEAA